MLRGLYTSALGMTTQMNRMDVISNNIANVNTTGFKRDRVITQSFTDEFMRRVNDPSISEPSRLPFRNSVPVGRYSLGTFVDDLATDFSTGSFNTTGGTFDLAINGSGFFAVNHRGQERYSRDGAFTLNQDRVLVTKDGFSVTGTNGNPITVPDGMVSINQTGEIFVDGELVNTIRLVDFENPALLRNQGSNLWNALDGAGPIPFTGRVEQGMLERSNVNIVREMVEMIEITRAYEANQRMVTVIDGTMQLAANDIGRK